MAKKQSNGTAPYEDTNAVYQCPVCATEISVPADTVASAIFCPACRVHRETKDLVKVR